MYFEISKFWIQMIHIIFHAKHHRNNVFIQHMCNCMCNNLPTLLLNAFALSNRGKHKRCIFFTLGFFCFYRKMVISRIIGTFYLSCKTDWKHDLFDLKCSLVFSTMFFQLWNTVLFYWKPRRSVIMGGIDRPIFHYIRHKRW